MYIKQVNFEVLLYLYLSNGSFINLIFSYLSGSSHGHLKALIIFWNLRMAKLVVRFLCKIF